MAQPAGVEDIDWASRWRRVVEERAALTQSQPDPGYWDRRAPCFAKSTRGRAEELLSVLEPYLSPRKTLIDVGAGAGRHTVPLASRLEWVTAIEPSEGMRAQIETRDNMTVVASTWEDATVAPADLVICSHVIYGVADIVPFLTKLSTSARERVFVMLRETDMPHPASLIRKRITGLAGARLPRFSELFQLLLQLRYAADVTFLRYPFINTYASFDEALTDCRVMLGAVWDETIARSVLAEVLTKRDGDLVYDGGEVLSGVAHWRP